MTSTEEALTSYTIPESQPTQEESKQSAVAISSEESKSTTAAVQLPAMTAKVEEACEAEAIEE